MLDGHSREEVLAHAVQVDLRKKRQLELKRGRENHAAGNPEAKKPKKASAAKKIMKRPAAKHPAPEELPEEAEKEVPPAAEDGMAVDGAENEVPPAAEDAAVAEPSSSRDGPEPEPKAKGRGRGRGGRGGRKARKVQEVPEEAAQADDEASAAEPKAKARGRGRGGRKPQEAVDDGPKARGRGRGAGKAKQQEAVEENGAPAEEEKTPPRMKLSEEQKRICRELLGCCRMSLSRYKRHFHVL